MANKLPATSFGRLVRRLKRTPMTHKQITQFLLKENGKQGRTPSGKNFYDSSLYGTTRRYGILEQYGLLTHDDLWYVLDNAPEGGPFTQLRW